MSAAENASRRAVQKPRSLDERRQGPDTTGQATNAVPSAPSFFMTAGEVARSLRVGRRTLDDLVAAGVVPAPIKLTRKTVRWLRTSVEAIGSAA